MYAPNKDIFANQALACKFHWAGVGVGACSAIGLYDTSLFIIEFSNLKMK